LMKKIAFLFVLLLILTGAVWGQSYYKWTGGAGDGLWTTAGNWATGTITETIDGQSVSITYSIPVPPTTINSYGTGYFIIDDVNGNNVPIPSGFSLIQIGNLVIKKGTLTLNAGAQCTNIIVEGGALIRNGTFLQISGGKVIMRGGILDLNGGNSINIPTSAWDITGGILIRDNVNSSSQPPPTINNDNVIVIGGPGGMAGSSGTTYIWTGNGSDTDWDTDNNWFGGISPGKGSNNFDIIINSTSPAPIPSTIECKTFIIKNGASFDLGSSTLTVNSEFENEGTFTCGTSTVVLSGTTVNVKGDNTFYDLNCTNATSIV